MTRINTVSDLNNLRQRILDERKNLRATMIICGGTGCQASRSRDVIDAGEEYRGRIKLTNLFIK